LIRTPIWQTGSGWIGSVLGQKVHHRVPRCGFVLRWHGVFKINAHSIGPGPDGFREALGANARHEQEGAKGFHLSGHLAEKFATSSAKNAQALFTGT
jgi:hypothetical protein